MLTQQEAAHLAGCSLSTVVRAERTGQWPSRPSVRRRLMQALGVSQAVGA
jgi:hypothetical protein